MCYVYSLYIPQLQDGKTPFKIAIELGEKDIILELVDNGATVLIESILFLIYTTD